MSRVWSFIRRDARNVCRNVISLVVCVGMVVIPSFYAWFNIAGSWDIRPLPSWRETLARWRAPF